MNRDPIRIRLTRHPVSTRVARRTWRRCRGWPSALLSTFLLLGCVDPFAEQTTTPEKYRGERRAAAAQQKQSEATEHNGTQKAKEEKQKPKQTYRQAWQLICEAEERSGVSAGKSRSERGAAVASWIVDNVTNKEARYWFIEFGNAKPQTKHALFLAEVERVGISPCPLLELLFPDGESADRESADGGPATSVSADAGS